MCPQTQPFPLSLCITLQQNCPHNSKCLSTFAQCSRYSTKTRENGALNSEFNYSRPSEMLVSRWIKPGSLSKPIFDLKGRQMCFRNIAIGLLPLGRCHLLLLAAVWPERSHASKSDKIITTARLSQVLGHRNYRDFVFIEDGSWKCKEKGPQVYRVS